MCPGRISTSPASSGQPRPSRPCPRAAPASAYACSTGWSRTPTNGSSAHRMAEIHFHDLAGRPLVPVLAGLLEPVVAAGERAVVVAGSEERLQAVDSGLWTYRPDSFLPHGTAADGHPEWQPVWLTVRE